MPLRALAESIETLSELVRMERKLRSQSDPPAGALEKVDSATDETIGTMSFLVKSITEAHARGDLSAMLKREQEDDGD